MRICIVKATKRIIGESSSAEPGTLAKNAISEFGLSLDEVEEKEVDAVGYAVEKAEDPVCIAQKQAETAQAALESAKAQAIAAAIPSVAAVEKNIDDAVKSDKPVEMLAVVVKDLLRAVAAVTNRS